MISFRWAPGNNGAAKLIQEILDQETAADKKLSEISAQANDEAMDESDAEEKPETVKKKK